MQSKLLCKCVDACNFPKQNSLLRIGIRCPHTQKALLLISPMLSPPLPMSLLPCPTPTLTLSISLSLYLSISLSLSPSLSRQKLSPSLSLSLSLSLCHSLSPTLSFSHSLFLPLSLSLFLSLSLSLSLSVSVSFSLTSPSRIFFGAKQALPHDYHCCPMGSRNAKSAICHHQASCSTSSKHEHQ